MMCSLWEQSDHSTSDSSQHLNLTDQLISYLIIETQTDTTANFTMQSGTSASVLSAVPCKDDEEETERMQNPKFEDVNRPRVLFVFLYSWIQDSNNLKPEILWAEWGNRTSMNWVSDRGMKLKSYNFLHCKKKTKTSLKRPSNHLWSFTLQWTQLLFMNLLTTAKL